METHGGLCLFVEYGADLWDLWRSMEVYVGFRNAIETYAASATYACERY